MIETVETASRQEMPTAQPIVARIPGSTYRLQFHAGFTFRDAAALVPYLRDLGVTDIYASPYLMARAGSSVKVSSSKKNTLTCGNQALALAISSTTWPTLRVR